MLSLPPPRHMPCLQCGASVERGTEAQHACDEERRLTYVLIQHRAELDAFEQQFSAWLETPHGRFERFYAERSRRS
jgi:hypothetical protein